MKNEKMTDLLVADYLKKAQISFTPNGSTIVDIEKALKTASKKGTGKKGYPEYIAKSGDFILVIEDKSSNDLQAKYVDDNKDALLMDNSSVMKYAENGALHYAMHIVQETGFKKCFAFGCSGTTKDHLIIRPIYVTPTHTKLLSPVRDFSLFSADNIGRYFYETVCGKKPIEQVELEEIIHRAERLHEDLRNYAQLGETEKPLVVSAILLALCETGFSTENLIGDRVETDGQKVYRALETHLDRVKVQPKVKKDAVLAQFNLIRTRPILSTINPHLERTPLRYFAEYIHSNILNAINSNTPEDVLGRFYGEFIRYSGGDGQSLGVVLTPRHITELFADLVDLRPTDVVFDPCCGTGGFLVAALHKMLKQAKTKDEQKDIKKNKLFGIEARDDMFAIATTNMILRGDGKSNLICGDCFNAKNREEFKDIGFTVGMMNPPYSQAKTKVTAHLSELKFILNLLDLLEEGGRAVVIVPQSVMIGKTFEDKADKRVLLQKHTLEGVITLNKDTFYGVGTNPVIAVFTAHKPHPTGKYAKFVDFRDDGYKVFPHIGLLPTSEAPAKKKYLLDCWSQGIPAPNSFIVRSTVLPEDEWLHSFYYFNEEIPTEAELEKTIADYLTFEFNMIAHDRGYLFEMRRFAESVEYKKSKKVQWKEFFISEIADIKSGQDIYEQERVAGNTPYITATAEQNGIGYFVGNNNSSLDKNCLSVNRNGSVGYAFYHPYTALYGNDTRKLVPKVKNMYVGLFLACSISKQRYKYGYGLKMGTGRLYRQRIMLPVTPKGKPNYTYMEKIMQGIEYKLLQRYKATKLNI